ncbi:hypothetical protein LDENG_00271140 [Lucifuga dentata]|nr:hypothetical protein LDENG_00271140 [Lucifuga dentata]
MFGGLVALIFLRTVPLIQSTEVPQLIALTVAKVGDDVTLQCNVSTNEVKFFYWYKQSFGHVVQTVVSATIGKIAPTGQFNNSRFTVTNNAAYYYLTIRNVIKEDEATYFCLAGTAYTMKFTSSTFLAVNDHNQQKSLFVKQQPETESVQLGDPVTLECSLLSKNKENRVQCPGEPSVYWFRDGSGESHPGLIYINQSAECVESQRSCVFSMSKRIKSSSDTGTYYCAVVACGKILFGDGTKVDTRPELDPVVPVLGILLVCCVIVIIVLVIFIKRRPVREHCKTTASGFYHPGHDMSPVDLSRDEAGEPEALNYAPLDFSSRKATRCQTKFSEPLQDCVYSGLRADWE